MRHYAKTDSERQAHGIDSQREREENQGYLHGIQPGCRYWLWRQEIPFPAGRIPD